MPTASSLSLAALAALEAMHRRVGDGRRANQLAIEETLRRRRTRSEAAGDAMAAVADG